MNNQNLSKGKATQFRSGEEAARNGRKGGLQLGINNAKRRAFKEYLESELTEEIKIGDFTVSAKEGLCFKLIQRMFDDKMCDRDFLRAFEFVRNTIGEQPVEKYAIQDIDQSVIDEVEHLVLSYEAES